MLSILYSSKNVDQNNYQNYKKFANSKLPNCPKPDQISVEGHFKLFDPKLQPQTFSTPDFSIMNFSTPNFSTMNF